MAASENPVFCRKRGRLPNEDFKDEMKKAITLSLLLLAGVITLACAVICHYHDESAVCLMTAHYAECEEPHEHSHAFDCHQDGGGNMEECPLDAYLVPVKQKLFIDPGINNDIQHPAALSHNSLSETTGLECLLLRLEPCPPPCHTDYISDSSGLRAPPSLV